MYLTPEKTRELAIKFGGSEKNTVDTSVQIAILTERILHLTNYMKENKKDFSAKRSLLTMVNKRKRLLKYLKRENYDKYIDVTKQLNIRR